MIDYDNPKHLKVFSAVAIFIAIPLGLYGLHKAANAVYDGYIYVDTSNFTGNIYLLKNPKLFYMFLSLFGLGGIFSLWIGIYQIWHFKYIGKWKDRL